VTEETTIPRRSVLAVGAAGVVVTGAALAGCGSDSSGGGERSPATTAPADSGASTPTGSGRADPPQGGTAALAKLNDVPSGGSMKVNGPDGKPMILFRDGSTVTGHTAICTHMGCTVNTNGAELDCPCHGSKFNAKDGSVINGPAQSPLPEIKVSVSGDSIVAG
jgi:cytochrome b6-f complex iron-sulfur subunit